MPDNQPTVTQLFVFQARTAKSGQTDVLEVDVRNNGAADWTRSLFIEFKLPADVAAQSLRDAALAARTKESPKNMVALPGVTDTAGWTVWAINDPNDHIVVIRVFNSGIAPETAKPTEPMTAFAAGASLTLRLPLAPAALNTQFTLRYGYQTGRGKETRVDGELDLVPSQHGDWKPKVSFECDWRNATMIEPGEKVTISWKIEDGVSATLRGPLPGGNSELTLSRDEAADYKMKEGSLSLLATGAVTYVLDAEVKGPQGSPNVQVIRTLTIDIFSVKDYAYLNVRPGSVLPNGQVDIEWAVWGVSSASIRVGDRLKLRLALTEQNLSRWYQGSGVWRVNAEANQPTEFVRIFITTDGQQRAWKDDTIVSTPWRPLEPKPVFTGKPLALAVAQGYMALLTRDGLWTALVGMSDTELKVPQFKKSAAVGKAWHALTAFGKEFAALRQTESDDIVLERYSEKGERTKLPVTLPGDFQALARRTGAVLDLVGFSNRVYVVVNVQVANRWARVAYSVAFDGDNSIRPEPLLAALGHYRLTTFDGALYAYHRGKGRLLRFDLTEKGELEPPKRAASAVNKDGVSMIRTGLLVSVGRVLAVLDPAALPALDSLPLFGLQNVLKCALEPMLAARKANEIPQDLVYNPQQDSWVACGQGLEIQAGAVAAYRDGASERIWVLQPDGKMHTITDATELLFTPEFVEKFPSKVLPSACDAVREFTLVNQTGIELVALDDVCRAAGLAPFESEGVAVLSTPMPERLPHLARHTFKVSYIKDDPQPVSLRLMAAGCRGQRYFVEVNLSGPGLTTVNSGFKRLAPDGSLANVPQTANRHMPNVDVTLNRMGLLLEKTAIFVINSSPYELSLDPRFGPEKVDPYERVEVAYTTPNFKVSVPSREGLGQVKVEIDYAAQQYDCVVSPGSEPQRTLIRLNTDNVNKLHVQSSQVNLYQTGSVQFERYDGSKFNIPPQRTNIYTCQVRPATKVPLDGVRLGDGALTRDGKSIFLALARPEDTTKVRIVKLDIQSRETRELALNTRGNVFSVPNAIAVSDRYYYATFGETNYHQAGLNFEYPFTVTLDRLKEILALAASPGGSIYYVARTDLTPTPLYSLRVLHYPENTGTFIPLEQISTPVVNVPLAVSPDGRTVVVSDKSGMLVVDVPNKKVEVVRNYELRDPAHVVFSPDGQLVFTAHVESAIASNPRRVVHGSDIIISRYPVGRYGEGQVQRLGNVSGDFGLTTNTKKSLTPGETLKEQVALSLAVSPDNRSLFVSVGKTIMQFGTSPMMRQPWQAETELPCRLIGAGRGVVYALGSSYVGDGTKADDYKTQLYFVPAPSA